MSAQESMRSAEESASESGETISEQKLREVLTDAVSKQPSLMQDQSFRTILGMLGESLAKPVRSLDAHNHFEKANQSRKSKLQQRSDLMQVSEQLNRQRDVLQNNAEYQRALKVSQLKDISDPM